jgi:hypothetical protein
MVHNDTILVIFIYIYILYYYILNMEENKHCYSFKEINVSSGIFDNIIDCCYVLVMEDSKREQTIIDRLSIKGFPCKKIKLQYNKGFRTCDKIIKKQKTNFDIIDANNNIFLDAKDNKFKNILVLEDDFNFTDKVKDPEVIKDLEKLYDNMEVNVFNLGTLIFIYNPLYLFYKKYNNINCLVSPLSQGIIHSPKFRNKFIEEYRLNKIDLDHFDGLFNPFFTNGIYCYKDPLCIQPFPETENSKEWSIFGIKNDKLFRTFIRYFELDSEYPIQGFKTTNRINYIVNLLVYGLIFIFIIWLLKK